MKPESIKVKVIEKGQEIEKDKFKCRILMPKNPLGDFFALPTGYQSSLWYSNILCGLIRGALEMINF